MQRRAIPFHLPKTLAPIKASNWQRVRPGWNKGVMTWTRELHAERERNISKFLFLFYPYVGSDGMHHLWNQTASHAWTKGRVHLHPCGSDIGTKHLHLPATRPGQVDSARHRVPGKSVECCKITYLFKPFLFLQHTLKHIKIAFLNSST